MSDSFRESVERWALARCTEGPIYDCFTRDLHRDYEEFTGIRVSPSRFGSMLTRVLPDTRTKRIRGRQLRFGVTLRSYFEFDCQQGLLTTCYCCGTATEDRPCAACQRHFCRLCYASSVSEYCRVCESAPLEYCCSKTAELQRLRDVLLLAGMSKQRFEF